MTPAQRIEVACDKWNKAYPTEDEIFNFSGIPLTTTDLEALLSEREDMLKALKSIAANTCCDSCQEAAMVAQKALNTAEGKEQ